jgi:hypothetical protein
MDETSKVAKFHRVCDTHHPVFPSLLSWDVPEQAKRTEGQNLSEKQAHKTPCFSLMLATKPGRSQRFGMKRFEGQELISEATLHQANQRVLILAAD